VSGAVARLRAMGDLAPDAPPPQTSVHPSAEGPEAGPGERPGQGPGEHARRTPPSRIDLLTPLAAVDPEALHVALDAVRALLHASSAADVRDVLVTMVERLGGTIGPAATQDDEVIPVDLSFGEGPPLIPRAGAASVARMRLELLLPPLVEDARAFAHRLGRSAPPSRRAAPVTVV
jgi:hypothetical protein